MKRSTQGVGREMSPRARRLTNIGGVLAVLFSIMAAVFFCFYPRSADANEFLEEDVGGEVVTSTLDYKCECVDGCPWLLRSSWVQAHYSTCRTNEKVVAWGETAMEGYFLDSIPLSLHMNNCCFKRSWILLLDQINNSLKLVVLFPDQCNGSITGEVEKWLPLWYMAFYYGGNYHEMGDLLSEAFSGAYQFRVREWTVE